jgi:hypothetical protein
MCIHALGVNYLWIAFTLNVLTAIADCHQLTMYCLTMYCLTM